MMNNWLFLALLSAIFAALVAIFGKAGMKNADPLAASAIRAIIMAAFLFTALLVEGKHGAWREVFTDGRTAFFVILSALAGAVSWVFYFWALKAGEASRVAVVDRTSVVFVIILAALFLGEKLTLKVGLGAALMTAGAILAIM
jgi:transporter family protein